MRSKKFEFLNLVNYLALLEKHNVKPPIWSTFKYVNVHYQQNIYTPYINLTNFKKKPSRSGDISLLVFKISREVVKQPCLDQKYNVYS